MSVAQSAIVAKWFKGKELAFALGLNISVSRLGSVINGIIVPKAYLSSGSLGFSLLVGFLICIASVITAICLVVMDKIADKKDGDSGKMISEEDKFKFSDIKSFKLSFWIISGSCVITYMGIFPFLQVVT